MSDQLRKVNQLTLMFVRYLSKRRRSTKVSIQIETIRGEF